MVFQGCLELTVGSGTDDAHSLWCVVKLHSASDLVSITVTRENRGKDKVSNRLASSNAD